ncbi:MAG: UDP-N-acetylmuramoyl-tripeptide--D-alanyl-D-alanine ligase [Oscillospiraceae bacterium]|nr:UDP-N-acetylmuramoyl-tripeptide--D-alanyl-D-alanine ligase [Oscillospiraceae bacterium]
MPLLTLFALLLPIIANIINAPVEKLNNRRYINDAKRIIDSHKNLITIGITGSYGKTSTKFFLHKLLSVKYNTLMTPESFNTTLGVVKTIRNDLKATHEIFICEMGLKWLGDIKEICDIVKPKHSVLTSIGPQHLETMKTQKNIIAEKFEIADCIKDGMVFLNYDNDFIINRKTNKNIIRYGLVEGNKDYLASDISVSERGTSFAVNGTKFETRLLGMHNVQNITGAIAVAHKLGIEMKDLVLPVKRLEPVPHRLQIINKGSDIIIDDAFNSNPVGANAALDVLKAFKGLRILVTPGMVELGEKEFELNKSFGFHATDCCDYVVLIGEKQAAPIKTGLLEGSFPEEKIKVFKTLNEGLEFVYKIDSKEQKIILLENDLPDNY